MSHQKPPELQSDRAIKLENRPRSERVAKMADAARPKLVASINQLLQSCNGARASFNAFMETHGRFVLAIHPKDHQIKDFGISFVSCLYLAGPTFWSNVQLRCSSIEDPDGELLYEVVDEAAGFCVRCDSIVVPALDLVFAHEWSQNLRPEKWSLLP